MEIRPTCFIVKFLSLINLVLIFGKVESKIINDSLVDPVSKQLFNFKAKHEKPIGILTTNSGSPVDLKDIFNLNGDVLTNRYFIESIQHLVNERIPSREVFSKGTGAHGYFEVTHDVTKYTKAKVFDTVGKKTPVISRLSTSQIEPGGSDIQPQVGRGISFKFYTEEGNLDLLGIQTPVYFYRDPALFIGLVHALSKNPKIHTFDFTTAIDFVTHVPEALHGFAWLVSEFGLPRGFRRMNSFPVHTFQIYNKQGQSSFVRFKFLTEIGYESFTLQEAARLTSMDPDFFTRDLFNSIENKDFPAWRLEMDVLNEIYIKNLTFYPFDVTSIWPNGTYHTEPIGRVVLNRNVNNHFAEVEQIALNPANLVLGILGPLDEIFKGRVIAYSDAQIHRLGKNHNKIDVNCPVAARTYNRDGMAPVLDNAKDSPNYLPNSFRGPEAYMDEGRPTQRMIIRTGNNVDLQPVQRFYNEVLSTDTQKQRLVDSIVLLSLRVADPVTKKFSELLMKADKGLATRYDTSLKIAKRTIVMPNVVEDLN